MKDSPVQIVAALPEEVRQLSRRHDLERSLEGPKGLECWRGQVRGHAVEVATTGIGAECARRGLERLLARGSAKALVFVGVAGALSPELEVGDLVVAKRVVSSHEPDPAIEVPVSAWAKRARGLDRARSGTLLSVPAIVSTAAGKRKLAARFANEVLALDMESFSWASVARHAGVPFLVVRAVSDTAVEDLPFDFSRAQRRDGSISRTRVVVGALGRPSSLPGLLELRDRVNLCSRNLEQAVVSILGRADVG